MAATVAPYVPARYDVVVVSSAVAPDRHAVVTGFNYCFERIDGVYVDYPNGSVNQLAWLHQIRPA